MNVVLDLFLTFAKIGFFTFGGGYAMISLIEDSCVEKKQWITHDEMMNVTVIAESTPGPIAINCATFVGYKQERLPGAITATVGMVLPSFCIIFVISVFLDNFLEIPLVAAAFRGMKVGVGVVILNAGLNMRKKVSKARLPQLLLALGFGAILLIDALSVKISTVVVILTAGLISLGVSLAGGGAKQ